MQKTVLKYIFKISLTILILLNASCATSRKLKSAREYKTQNKYVQAILLYDEYIERNPNTAEKTLAELERSKCYYELGLKAYNSDEYDKARNFLLLANSDQADKLLDDVLWELAVMAANAEDKELEQKQYTYILEYIPTSPLTPKVMLAQIKLYLETGENILAYNTLKELVTNYRDLTETSEAVELINPILPELMQKSYEKKLAGKFGDAIEEYKLYLDCPSSYQDEIKSEIADSYLLWGIEEKKRGNFTFMNEQFELALEYDSSLRNRIDRERDEICNIFLSDGDELKAAGRFDEALLEYQKCFQVVPDHQGANQSIDSITQLRLNFAKAADLEKQAKRKESSEEYSEAKKLYQQAYNLSKNEELNEDINRMETFLKIAEDPISFALKVVKDYKNKTISENVDKVFEELELKHPNEASISDWKANYSFGEFKYEVRVDILSPSKNYYLAWRVNLLTKKIDPLNKASEDMMERS